jgi:hypothetical protein
MLEKTWRETLISLGHLMCHERRTCWTCLRVLQYSLYITFFRVTLIYYVSSILGYGNPDIYVCELEKQKSRSVTEKCYYMFVHVYSSLLCFSCLWSL